MARFVEQAEATAGKRFADYAELHRWSVENPGAFWQLVWTFTDVLAVTKESPANDVTPAGTPANAPRVAVEDLDVFPGARWFPGTRLNYAANLLRCRDESPAIIATLETGARRQLSFADLHLQTAKVAARLKILGVQPGDRVAGWLPNVPEAVIAMLATASLGAVWSSCSPDFGSEGALDRFGQIEPKVLFACDGYYYGGKTLDTVGKVNAVRARVGSISEIVWVELIGTAPANNGCRFADLLNDTATDIDFVERDFVDPLYVMYSSGTTGKPKCIVHSIGGTLLQHLKEHQLHTDVNPGDRLFYFTTCGWMMWNWLVSGLASGATLMLYDGSPFHPEADTLIRLAQDERVDIFGVSAKYLSALEKAGVKPAGSHDLKSVRTILSTGSPLTHESFQYVYRDVKADVHLASISGGTDLISCFALGNPMQPVWEGELQCKGLGMAVEVWDEDGQRLTRGKGELVCTRAFPSCPIGFWNDPRDERFREAYFDRFPGVWAHGDFAEETPNGGLIIHGRSDAVLNPGGVRIGTAEIYRQVEQLDAIQEAICVGQDWEDDVRVVLFVTLIEGARLSDELIDEIRGRLRQHASPRHVPAKVVQVTDIPRTRSGKIVELAVRDLIHGREPKNVSALANPEALAQFRDRPELAD